MLRTVAPCCGPVCLLLVAGVQAADPPRPAPTNVLVILADDMGFSDAGCYGGEIATPNLDALTQNGLRYTQSYNTTRCPPSIPRASAFLLRRVVQHPSGLLPATWRRSIS
jgi:hypothetical protein